MVNANDLIKEQLKRDEIKKKTFDKVYNTIEKKIILASAASLYYAWYEVPEFILGLPTYKLKECIEYIKNKLEDNAFKCEWHAPNILLIKWFPS
jgi:hypothetical protein|uniref:Uncharacterized protein n=1 Tax=viral metagenome TaxID=1070528 RepID=A0A6C0ITD5_9ZZZZ